MSEKGRQVPIERLANSQLGPYFINTILFVSVNPPTSNRYR
jgi:hypothetical protein